MTEREKRIEEMKKCVCDVYDNTVRHTVNIVDLVCGILEQECYRKADEIFKKCKEKCMFQGYPYGIDYTELVEVFKEFSVEVEE